MSSSEISSKINELETTIELLNSGIIFCSYDYKSTREIIQQRLTTRFEGESTRFLELEYSDRYNFQRDIKGIIMKNKSYNFGRFESKFVVSIFANDLATDSLWYCNLIRSFFLKLEVIIIFWISESSLLNINRLAPDLWRVRNKLVNFINDDARLLKPQDSGIEITSDHYYPKEVHGFFESCASLIKQFEYEKKWDKVEKYQKIIHKLNDKAVFQKENYEDLHEIVIEFILLEKFDYAILLSNRLHGDILDSEDYLNPKNNQVSRWCRNMGDMFKKMHSDHNAEKYYAFAEQYTE